MDQISLFASFPSPSNLPVDFLRPYQVEALSAVNEALSVGLHPVVALPTGAGKSRIISALCHQQEGRKLVVTHRKELLLQNSEEFSALDSGSSYGLYSAGLDQRETDTRIVFGGIQSIYRQMDKLQMAGKFELIIIDECHLVPRPSSPSMYATVFRACPDALRVGLSATPYRLNDGPVWDEKDAFFDTLACDVSISSLTPLYLAPLRGILTAHDLDLSGVRIQQGEYVLSDMSQVACEETVVDGA